MSHLENKMHKDGKARFQRKAQKAKKDGYETILPGQNALVKKSISRVAHKIQEFVELSCKGKPTKHARVGLTLKDMEPDVIAVIVSKILMNQLHKQNALTTVSIKLSHALDMERNLQTLVTEHQRYYDFMIRQLHQTIISPHVVQAIAIKQARRQGLVLSEERETSEHLQIGKKLIELFAEATGFISIEKRLAEKGTHPQYTVLPTTEALDFIKKVHQRMEVLSPVFGPITQVPQPRISIDEGGFETLPTLLVKNRHEKVLETTYKDHAMPNVYTALNAIQSTPYAINKRVHEVVQTLWERKLVLAGLPEHYDKRKHEHPSKKHPEGTFKRRDREELLGKNLACILTLSVAKDYLEHEMFYFVHTLDFRGRAYPVTSHLSPQGNDLNKGLLTFAASQGKPLGKDGVKWLAIHGANCYGVDKVSFDERVAWVRQHQDRILAAAQDPFSDYWWTDAKDKPLQFLAFCFEWAGYCEQGESYVCALPVAVDGSSNALQHFAALLKDKELGTRVNMTPLDKPNDIYQEICDKLMIKAKEDTKKNRYSPSKHWIKQLSRSVIKQPVMTYYYGAKYRGMWQQIEKAARDAKLVFPKNQKDHTYTCITWLVKAIRELIPQEIPTVKVVMDFLQKVAKECCKENKPIIWTTPSGFKVVLNEVSTKSRQIKTQLFGELIKLSYQETVLPPVYDLYRQTSGVSAHFVHSLDASAMTLCVNEALSQGVTSFRMIHDGFATVPGDMETLSQCIRISFSKMYTEQNVLKRLVEEALGPEHPLVASLPAQSDLNLSHLILARYFFA